MPTTDPIIIPIEGDPKDFVKDAGTVNKELDKLQANVKQSASGIAPAMKQASLSFTDFRSAYMIALDAIRAGQAVWAQTGQVFLDYAEQVKNMSRNIGASAEETSRLIQVADDVRISYGTLNVAMKELQKDGISASVDSLAKLSDQYLKLQPGVARTQFLLDNFGKSGLEMGKLMEQGGQKIRGMSDAIDDSLVLTDEAIKANDEYRKTMDNLNDSMTAIKVEIGGGLVPIFNAFSRIVLADIEVVKGFIEMVDDGTTSLEKIREITGDAINNNGFELFGITIGNVEETTQELTGTLDDNSGAVLDNKEAIAAANDALKVYKDQIDAVTEANQRQLDLTLDVANAQRDYEQAHAEAAAKVSRAMAGGNQEEIQQAIAGIQELEAEWHKSTESMIFDMVRARVEVDGLTNAEFDALQDLAVQKGLITQADADRAKALNDEADAIAEGIAAQEDVKNQNEANAARLAELEAQKTAAQQGTTAAIVESTGAMGAFTGQAQTATAQVQALTAQIMQTAAAAASIKIPSVGGGMVQAQIPALKSISAKTGGFGGKRDSGGPGEAGQAYMIGTGAQPEMFIPSTSGSFVPNADKIGGKTIIVNITNPQPKAAEQSIRDQLKNLSYLGVTN